MQSILILKKVKNPRGHHRLHVLLSRFVVIVIPALAVSSGCFPMFHRIHGRVAVTI